MSSGRPPSSISIGGRFSTLGRLPLTVTRLPLHVGQILTKTVTTSLGTYDQCFLTAAYVLSRPPCLTSSCATAIVSYRFGRRTTFFSSCRTESPSVALSSVKRWRTQKRSCGSPCFVSSGFCKICSTMLCRCDDTTRAGEVSSTVAGQRSERGRTQGLVAFDGVERRDVGVDGRVVLLTVGHRPLVDLSGRAGRNVLLSVPGRRPRNSTRIGGVDGGRSTLQLLRLVLLLGAAVGRDGLVVTVHECLLAQVRLQAGEELWRGLRELEVVFGFARGEIRLALSVEVAVVGLEHALERVGEAQARRRERVGRRCRREREECSCVGGERRDGQRGSTRPSEARRLVHRALRGDECGGESDRGGEGRPVHTPTSFVHRLKPSRGPSG